MAAAWGCYQKPGRGRAVVDWSHALARGLVGLWPFNEGGGPPANVAALNTATTNTMAWAAGPGRGWVISNSATSKLVQVTVPSGSPLDVIGTGITWGAWIYPLSAIGNFQCILGKSDATGAANRQYQLMLSPSNTSQLAITLGGNGSTNVYNNPTLAISTPWVANAWNAIFVTYNGASVVAYLNGASVGSASATGSLTSVGGTVFMGYDPNQANYGISGSLDMPAVWNRALSAAEMARFVANPYRLFRPAVDIGWLTSGSVAPPSTAYRRTLYDRAGSRGIA